MTNVIYGKGLYWNNMQGWVSLEEATRFTDKEKETLDLPLNGEWIEENAAKTVKLDRYKNFSTYVGDNPVDIYIDYNDELSEKQITQVLEGNSNDVRMEIEDYAQANDDGDYYWDNMAEELNVDREVIEAWRDEEGFWPGQYLSDHSWSQLIRNSRAYITATVDGCEYNFNNWAYGYPIEYTSPISYPNNPDGAGIGMTLKVLGINPKEFRDKLGGGSQTAGPGMFKGYWPDIKNRVPAVEVEELDKNGLTLYDSVLTFCLGDLENVAEVLSGDSKNITFLKGTNIVMYDFNGGAFVTEATLIEDVTIPRKKLDFRNDNANSYGIQSCAGLVHEFWTAGTIC